MRAEILYSLFSSLSSLSGVGPATMRTLNRLGIEKNIHLLQHIPIGVSHHPLRESILQCPPGETSAVIVKIISHEPSPTPKRPYKVICHDHTGTLTLTFFKAYASSLQKLLPIGSERLVCGQFEIFMGQKQISHPERILPKESVLRWQEYSPLYPLTAGLTHLTLQKLIRNALSKLPALPEWLPLELLMQKGWPSWNEALKKCHNPLDPKDILNNHPARERLAYDEFLSEQLSLLLVRTYHKKKQGHSMAGTGILKQKILESFGRPLTSCQQRANEEISQDMLSPHRMIRLLQGDVGSGKTLVALLAMVQAVESRYQAVLLAPTEILARQHAASLQKLVSSTGIQIDVLTGRDKGKKRSEIYDKIKEGQTSIIIGTHALLQEQVVFHNLGLAVIDEQHRFGVEQRLQLTTKAPSIDVLVMTATPIPRTLMLTQYGDLDVSILKEKPQGRQPIQTRLISLEKIDEIIEGLKRALSQQGQVYWVCPLVEESENLDLSAATDRYQFLMHVFNEKEVGLIHGKMKSDEKDMVMSRFQQGDIKILVSTTVIEVGIDVPQANIMVIEHAERFGLSQLHQLRGRVGRGTAISSCVLLYGKDISFVAKQRLSILRETENGFLIAEEDLKIRGGGEFLGTRQSGQRPYQFVHPSDHAHLLDKSHLHAKEILMRDPRLESHEGKSLRLLLSLFERDHVLNTLESG